MVCAAQVPGMLTYYKYIISNPHQNPLREVILSIFLKPRELEGKYISKVGGRQGQNSSFYLPSSKVSILSTILCSPKWPLFLLKSCNISCPVLIMWHPDCTVKITNTSKQHKQGVWAEHNTAGSGDHGEPGSMGPAQGWLLCKASSLSPHVAKSGKLISEIFM